MKRGVALVLGLVLWAGLGSNVERAINRPAHGPLSSVSDAARALHDASWVADLHTDSLLFGRNLLKASKVGHVDLPRLREGGVAFQVFGAPTVTPWNQNFERTDGDAFDALTLAGWLQLSHYAWNGPLARAEHMARSLQRMAGASHGELVLVRSGADFAALRRRQSAGHPAVGALLAIEGAHAAESTPAGMQRLFDAGYRMVGLAHFFDNDYTGSAHGLEKGGLTPLGRRAVRQLEALGVTLDVAHLSPTAIDELLAMVTKPVVVSHGGVRGTCDNLRTLSDAHVRAIAAGGGMIGIGYFDGTICGNTPERVAAAARYIVDLVGDEHVGLGSDYDGAILPGFDTSKLAHVTQALLDVGLPPESIRRILGENLARILAHNLP